MVTINHNHGDPTLTNSSAEKQQKMTVIQASNINLLVSYFFSTISLDTQMTF